MTSADFFNHIIRLRVQYEKSVNDFVSTLNDDMLADLIRESREGGHGPLGYYIAERLEQALGGRKLERDVQKHFDALKETSGALGADLGGGSRLPHEEARSPKQGDSK